MFRTVQISPENSRKLTGVWASVQASFVAVTCTNEHPRNAKMRVKMVEYGAKMHIAWPRPSMLRPENTM